VVVFVITVQGFEEMKPLINSGKYPVWFSGGIKEQDYIDNCIVEGVDVSYFNYEIELTDNEAIVGAIQTINEHHPGERIWTEYKLN